MRQIRQNSNPLCNKSGFTIPEALMAFLIVTVSLTGLLMAYSIGHGYLEEYGIKRAALAHLQDEMEEVRSFTKNGLYSPEALAFANKEVQLISSFRDKERQIPAYLTLRVSPEQEEQSLSYNLVEAICTFTFENQPETLSVAARFYRD